MKFSLEYFQCQASQFLSKKETPLWKTSTFPKHHFSLSFHSAVCFPAMPMAMHSDNPRKDFSFRSLRELIHSKHGQLPTTSHCKKIYLKRDSHLSLSEPCCPFVTVTKTTLSCPVRLLSYCQTLDSFDFSDLRLKISANSNHKQIYSSHRLYYHRLYYRVWMTETAWLCTLCHSDD